MALAALPVELWLEIFRWATISPAAPAATYAPFQTAPGDPFSDEEHTVAATKCALTRVCKQWHYLAQEFLFEDVIIERDAAALRRALRTAGAEAGRDHHRRVRRAFLPYGSCTPCNYTDSEAVADLLESCRHLEVLVRPSGVRPDEMRFEVPATDCPPLASLKRLDWWHYNEAARSGGVNALSDVLRAAPNLEYLSLGGELWINLVQRGTLELAALKTLRVRLINALFMHQLARWRMPRLRTLVVDNFSLPGLFETLAERYSEQITRLELGRNIKFYVMDLVSHLLTYFPHIEELGYYLEYTAIPAPPQAVHFDLQTLRLHAFPNEFFSVDAQPFWDHLTEHLGAYPHTLFPALKRVELHGGWDRIVCDPRFSAISKRLRERGITVAFAH